VQLWNSARGGGGVKTSENTRWYVQYLLVPLLAAFIGGPILWNYVRSPVIVYEVLPLYQIGDEAIGAVVFSNDGRGTAHAIRATVKASGTITDWTFDTPEAVVVTQEKPEILVVRMERLARGSSLSLILRGTGLSPLDVKLTSEETTGIPRSSVNDSLVTLIAMIIGGAMVAYYNHLSGILRRERNLKELEAIRKVGAQYEELLNRTSTR